MTFQFAHPKCLLVLAVVASFACGTDAQDQKPADAPLPDPSEFDHADTAPLSACTDLSHANAITLALRMQVSLVLSDALVADYEWLLETAREAHPELCRMSPNVDYVPNELTMITSNDSIQSAWKDGRQRTGRLDVDRILNPFHVVGFEEQAPGWFQLTFAETLKLTLLEEQLNATGVVEARVNWYGYALGSFCNPRDDGQHTCYFGGPAKFELTRSEGATTLTFQATAIVVPEPTFFFPTYTVVVGDDGTVGPLLESAP